MNRRASYFVLFVAIALWNTGTDSVLGQTQLAAISGTITDPSGAAIGDASVVLRQKRIGLERRAEPQPGGLYHIEGVEPGDYELDVDCPGFGSAVYSLTLRVGDHLTVNVPLELGK